jgi:hypothetical protein
VIITELASIDTSLKEECKNPVKLPDRGLSPSETARYWSQDRLNLALCKTGKSSLVKAIEQRDSIQTQTKTK